MCWFKVLWVWEPETLYLPIVFISVSAVNFEFLEVLSFRVRIHLLRFFHLLPSESSLTLLFFLYSHQTRQNILLASSWTHTQSELACMYLTNICCLDFYNNLLTGSTTFFLVLWSRCLFDPLNLPSALVYALASTELHSARISGRRSVGERIVWGLISLLGLM